jgi:hypothetical protein
MYRSYSVLVLSGRIHRLAEEGIVGFGHVNRKLWGKEYNKVKVRLEMALGARALFLTW